MLRLTPFQRGILNQYRELYHNQKAHEASFGAQIPLPEIIIFDAQDAIYESRVVQARLDPPQELSPSEQAYNARVIERISDGFSGAPPHNSRKQTETPIQYSKANQRIIDSILGGT